MMRTQGMAMAFAAALLACGCESFELRPPPDRQIAADAELVFDPDRVAAIVASLEAAAELEQKALRSGFQLLERAHLDGLDLWLLTFGMPKGMDAATGIRMLERLEVDVTAGAIHRYDRERPEERRLLANAQPRTFAGQLIGWPNQGCLARHKVGMIDGEVDVAGGALRQQDLVQRAFMETAPSASARPHATAIAELLAGAGRLSEVRLYSAAVVRTDPRAPDGASVTALIKALDWMVANEVPLINISLAGPYNKLLDRAVQRTLQRGAVLVAAVGNEGPQAPPRYPAAFPGVIAATAVDAAARVYSMAVQGAHVDVAAPGVDVFVAGDGPGRYLSGTSIAAPFVTARLASDPRLGASSDPAEEALRLLAADALDLGAAGRDPVFGLGLVQASASCAP